MLVNKPQIEAEMARLKKRISLLGLINTPGIVATAIAYNALFSDANLSSLHPLLGDRVLMLTTLGIGIIWICVCLKQFLNTSHKLKQLRARLEALDG